MKILIITVAGMSTRFSQSVGYPCLKCLYHENDPKESLLYRLLHQGVEFDRYIIVGGFLYEELEAALEENFQELRDRIILVKNDHYADFGSCYSLYLALWRIRDMDYDEVIFAEGDLYVDRESFRSVCESPKDVITCCREPILADRSVAFYFDCSCGIHYLYDTGHNRLEIREPFLGIFNSGQIWKFADASRLKEVTASIGREEWKGTNLVPIQKYFGASGLDACHLITFEEWINCNTVSDYRRIPGGRKQEREMIRAGEGPAVWM